MEYTAHTVVEMDQETREQRCVICGELIHSANGASFPPSPEPPKGYAPGVVYLSKTVNPQYINTTLMEEDNAENCKP